MKLKPVVGEALWYVNDFSDEKREVIVSKVGSRWIYFDNGERRCEFDGDVDEWGGKCYQSKADYEAQNAISIAWKALSIRMQTPRPPVGITINRINQAKNWLFGSDK